MTRWKEIIGETFSDYIKRYWRFWLVLYVFVVLAEISREIFLESVVVPGVSGQGSDIFWNLALSKIRQSPAIAISLLAMMSFSLWGFASLYFSFAGRNFKDSVLNGLRNFFPYLGVAISGGFLVFLGLMIVTVPFLTILDYFASPPIFLADGVSLNPLISWPALLVFGIPGWWLLVAFSSAPFILFFEKRGVFESLRESYRRVSKEPFRAAAILVSAFFFSAAAYYFLMWVVFSLKLIFIPDLSFRGETNLRIFLYSVPWVVVASFFDLCVYKLYLHFRDNKSSGEIQQRSGPKYFSARK